MATSKNIQWHTPVELLSKKPKSGEMPCPFRLPAVFLKKHNLLINVLGEDYDFTKDFRQYGLDFDLYKKDGKNIDELFEEYKGKRPPYPQMFKFCQFLYRKLDYHNDEKRNVYKQFEQEYKKFRNSFFTGLNDEKLPKFDPSVDRADFLKIFILYRSLKIRNVKEPLNTEREWLPDVSEHGENETNAFDLDNIFLANIATTSGENKDNSTIAPLCNDYNSPNGVFIEKLYAMLWYNAKFEEGEIQRIINYIRDLERFACFIQYSDELQKIFNGAYKTGLSQHKSETETEKYAFAETKKWIQDAFNIASQCITNRPLEDVRNIESDGKESDVHDNKISLFGYFIIKIYIENHIRLCNIEASKLNGKDDFSNTEVHVDMERLQRVREIVKDVKIKNPKDIVKICDKKLFSRKERQEIRDFVFAGITTPDGKKKPAKPNKKSDCRKNINYSNIWTLYKRWWIDDMIKRGTASKKDEELCFHLIVAAGLYFFLKNRGIELPKAKRYNDCKLKQINKPTIANIFTLFRENHTLNITDETDEANQNNKDTCNSIFEAKEFSYYHLRTGQLLRRYYPLFNGHNVITEEQYRMIIGTFNTEMTKFWKRALLNAYNLVV